MSGLREVLDQLNSRWHGRAEQIQSLIALLAPALYDKASLHVYGPAGSGKTGLLRCAAVRPKSKIIPIESSTITH